MMRMFVHAEALVEQVLNDYEMTAFIRIGSDQTDNYYEYEVPLQVTSPDNTAMTSEDSCGPMKTCSRSIWMIWLT